MEYFADSVNDLLNNLRGAQFMAFTEITLQGSLSMESFAYVEEVITRVENLAGCMQLVESGCRMAGTFASRQSPVQVLLKAAQDARVQLAILEVDLRIDVSAACASVERAGLADYVIAQDLERWYQEACRG